MKVNTAQGGKASLGTSPVIEAENAQTAALVLALRAAGNNPQAIRRALVDNYPEPHRAKLLATFALLKLAV
jgi:homoserine kinase